MRALLTFFLFLSMLIQAETDSTEVYKSGWYLGASAIYPRYMNITKTSIASHKNFGISLHLGWNITEHFGFRITPNYIHLHSFYYDLNNKGLEVDNYLNMGTINLEAIYNFVPCGIVSPYFLVGYGATYFKSTNPYPSGKIKGVHSEYQAELGLGAEFKFWDDFTVKAEFDYVTASNNRIDGNQSQNESKGILFSNGDSYMTLNLGINWYFFRGERSKICDPFSIKEVITEIPVEVEKVIIDTVYIDRIIEKAIAEKESFVIENVRFKFDQDLLTDEAQIILNNVAKVLNKFPEEKIEILGHTDNWGTDEYNLDLSKRRALAVKNYLITHGVDSTRLMAAGCGERMPIADNNTSDGRAINRRIEFVIYEGVSSSCVEVDENTKIKNSQTKFSNQQEEEMAKALLKGENLSFTNIRFKTDSAEITEPSKEILDNLIGVLKRLTSLKLQIQGHTDSDGTEAHNQDLSKRRAYSVKVYLVKHGIDALRLSTIGFGESKPIASNKTAEGKAKNRRIEFKKID